LRISSVSSICSTPRNNLRRLHEINTTRRLLSNAELHHRLFSVIEQEIRSRGQSKLNWKTINSFTKPASAFGSLLHVYLRIWLVKEPYRCCKMLRIAFSFVMTLSCILSLLLEWRCLCRPKTDIIML
jgi:hypothetical protein